MSRFMSLGAFGSFTLLCVLSGQEVRRVEKGLGPNIMA